jgi:hypothetical protein
MLRNLRPLIACLGLTLPSVLPASGQIAADTSLAAPALVQQFLLGSGILLGDVTATGATAQCGSFTSGDALGIPDGILLGTGPIHDLQPGGSGTYLPYTALSTDADLLTVAQSVPTLIGQPFYISGVYDVASLAFDFIPLGDSLAFTFTFVSEEYPTWINSSFNDVFGFFVSGPGLSGPYENGAVNIAIVPGSTPTLPITISSVNGLLNSEFYVAATPTGAFSAAVGGYTVPLTATLSGLQVGATYHIRLAIADGSDTALNSYVLLQSGSFNAVLTVPPGSTGDFDSDGQVDVQDLLIFTANFGCTGTCVADLDGDGATDIADLLAFLVLFE